jgi:hypothetical protein
MTTVVIEERSYVCPLCQRAGKLSVTLRSDGRWRYRCRSQTCRESASSPLAWWDNFAYVLGASYAELYDNPEPWLSQARGAAIPGGKPTSAFTVIDALPTEEQLTVFRRRARRFKVHRDFLKLGKGFSAQTVSDAEIGFAEAHELRGVFGHRAAYTFPVYQDGELVNVMRRFVDGRRPKWAGLSGRPRAIFPSPPTTDRVVIVEGPPDPLMLRQHGFDGVSVTHGCPTQWPEEWVALVAGRCCAVAYDVDALANATNLAAFLRDNGVQAFPVDMRRLAGLTDTGDVSDYFIAGHTADDFRQVLNAAYGEHRAVGRRGGGSR